MEEQRSMSFLLLAGKGCFFTRRTHDANADQPSTKGAPTSFPLLDEGSSTHEETNESEEEAQGEALHLEHPLEKREDERKEQSEHENESTNAYLSVSQDVFHSTYLSKATGLSNF